MLGRGVRVWLRPAIFFSAVCGSAAICSASAYAQDEGPDSISALPTPNGPDESTPAADYVRRPTDPPPFNPRGAQATAARKREAAKREAATREAAKRQLAEVPTTDGTSVVAPPGSAKVMTSQLPVAAARPKNSRLAGDRLSKRFGIVLPDWKQGLALCIEELGPRFRGDNIRARTT